MELIILTSTRKICNLSLTDTSVPERDSQADCIWKVKKKHFRWFSCLNFEIYVGCLTSRKYWFRVIVVISSAFFVAIVELWTNVSFAVT